MLKITWVYVKLLFVKRIFIALICLIVFSVPFLFVGCGNPPTNPPSNIESEEPEIESGSSNGGGELPSDPEEPIIPEDPTEPETPLDPIIPPENNNPEEPENPIEPENPDTPNNPDSDDDGSDNSSNPPVDDSLQENPPTDPTPDNNEPEIPVEPEPEPEPLVRFDFTIYNFKKIYGYDKKGENKTTIFSILFFISTQMLEL